MTPVPAACLRSAGLADDNAVDGVVNAEGLAAWIQPRGQVAHLIVADDTRLLLDHTLGHNTLDFGYEGCDAVVVGWYGDKLIVQSAERGGSIVWRFDLSGGPPKTIRAISAVCVGGMVFFASRDPGRLARATLPDLDPLTPLPIKPVPGRYALLSGEDGAIIIKTQVPEPGRRGRLIWRETQRIVIRDKTL